jgi:hypothetical protein
MSLLSCLANVVKASFAVAASPVALIADLATLPASAEYDRHPFERTGKMLGAAGRCMSEAVKPEKGEGL